MRLLAFGAGLVLLAGALAACDAPRAAQPQLWTLFDVQALYAAGAQRDDAIATDAGLPGGVTLEQACSTPPITATLFAAARRSPRATTAAYLTTEVWSHFDEVWLQPMYIPVTGWVGRRAQAARAVGSAWIFSVGPGSRFYSPFWQMIYFDVPDGTLPDAITSARQVLDGKYPLHSGPGRTVSLRRPTGLVASPRCRRAARMHGNGLARRQRQRRSSNFGRRRSPGTPTA